jgi:hypothetical protein
MIGLDMLAYQMVEVLAGEVREVKSTSARAQ